jgi:hypothetical protein
MNLLKTYVPIENFLPHVMVNTVGDETSGSLPENAAISFIRNAAFKFAEKTGILTHDVKIDLQCGLGEYPVEIPTCETIIGVKNARLQNFETEDCGKFWSWGNVDFAFDDDVLFVEPAPTSDVADGLLAKVIVAPARDACELNSVLYDKWHDAIINGALSEIHMIPSRPWSSVSRADYRRRLFEEDISRATIRKVMQGRRQYMDIKMNPDWFTCKTSQRRW